MHCKAKGDIGQALLGRDECDLARQLGPRQWGDRQRIDLRTRGQKGKRCQNRPAKRLLRKLLKRQGIAPRVMITDKLASDGADKREIMPGIELRQHRDLNKRAGNSCPSFCADSECLMVIRRREGVARCRKPLAQLIKHQTVAEEISGIR